MGRQGSHLSVPEVATALGTSPQTVRTLLRTGQLRGVQRPWGSRYVWEVDADGLADFISVHGRLDGKRRSRSTGSDEPASAAVVAVAPRQVIDRSSTTELSARPPDEVALLDPPEERFGRRPRLLRPRWRAAVVLTVLLVPLLCAHAAAQVLPNVWWFEEVGQGAVFRDTLEIKVELRLLAGGIAATFVWLNLMVAGRSTWLERTRWGLLVCPAAAVVIGTLFASSAAHHWQSYLLWRHPQFVGVTEPLHGKDVGFFLFSLPFELVMSGMLLWLIGVTIAVVVLLHVATGDIRVRPLQATLRVQVHLALLVSLFLLAVARRLFLERYLLELRQGDAQGSSFAGAHYVDVHVRTPVLSTLVVAAVVLALVVPVVPFALQRTWSRKTRRVAVGIGLLVTAAVAFALTLLPALVQRFAVEPDHIASEAPYVASSAVATQQALGLDQIDVEAYSPSRPVSPDDFRSVDDRLEQVTTWDTALLGARMQQMVTDTPYYSPQSPDLDVVRVGGTRQVTVVSARELDTSAGDIDTHDWGSDRLAYTHGMGLIRFSGADAGPDREPVLLDSGSKVREPRIYFGDLPSPDPATPSGAGNGVLAQAGVDDLAASPWVLVDTRRPEVDVSAGSDTPSARYHYAGRAGISMSTWERRTILALAVGSKQVLLSDDITAQSRMLLHRDVHDRLRTLAPFLDWDAQSFPLTVGGHIVFVVDGYTTSDDYPFAQRVALGGSLVNYARASVRATVDAYTGEVRMYVTDPSDPLIRSWSASFPTLFTPADQMPQELKRRGRYPSELFAAQASAYERFHTDDPDTLASGSDEWSRPVGLSGPLEVAGGVDFDESDEDDLKLTLQPGYFLAPPPGSSADASRLLLKTYYAPRRGQNLVATLTGWVDRLGRPHLESKSLPRDPVALGPAQISRLVFATPRVRNLLGLRNLEIRDLEKSSLDSVYLGVPHLLLLPEGPVQVQSLFEGSRGPGAARMLGVTVFINGRAGLGPDVTSALRQALNSPPVVKFHRPPDAVSVGTPVSLGFRVGNAQREDVTIRWAGRQRHERLHVRDGDGTLRWTPRASGRVHVSVSVRGLDGTTVTDGMSFTVLSRPPVIRLVHAPQEVVAGQPVRIVFRLSHGHRASARVSTKEGIVFARDYALDDHVGVLEWTPESPGRADVLLRAQGGQGQTARTSLRLRVLPFSAPNPPTVAIVHVPAELRVSRSAHFSFTADDCSVATARLRTPEDDSQVWTWPCPVRMGVFEWVPDAPGRYTLVVRATSAQGLTASQSDVVRVRPAGAGISP